MRRIPLAAAALALGLAITISPVASALNTPVYLESANAAASLQTLLTTGDTIGGYQLPGIPDGLGVRMDGAYAQILMNHEISPAASAVKRVGGATTGSTISSLTFDPASGKVIAAGEAIKRVTWFDYASGKYGNTPGAPLGAIAVDAYGVAQHGTAISRFCSANLVQSGALSATENGIVYGYAGAAFFTGEESGDESRAWALNMDGELVQLGAFGLGAWENIVQVPTANRASAFMLNEDGSATDSQLFMYVGEKERQSVTTTTLVKKRVKVKGKYLTRTTKKSTTTTIPWYQAAGLTNGKFYVMKIGDFAVEKDFRAAVGKNASTTVTFNAVDASTNGKVQHQVAALQGTSLARVEDGSFDPNHPNDYYFVTTESNKDAKATVSNPATPSIKRDGGALWRLRFKDAKNPLAGATITMLLDGSEAPYLNKPDNITVDGSGNILMQEDPGNNDHLSRVLAYRISDGKIAVLAQFKKQYFSKSETATFMTIDEESSGIVEATALLKSGSSDKASYYLLDAQVHTTPSITRPDITDTAAKAALDLNAVEGGQLYALKISDWAAVYAA